MANKTDAQLKTDINATALKYDDRYSYTQSLKNGLADVVDSKERLLGNPDVDGKILSSTVAGVRSWVNPTSGGGSGDLFKATSTTSVNLGTLLLETSVIIGVVAGLAYTAGQSIRCYSISNPVDFFSGTVVSYSTTVLTVKVFKKSGILSRADWQINVSSYMPYTPLLASFLPQPQFTQSSDTTFFSYTIQPNQLKNDGDIIEYHARFLAYYDTTGDKFCSTYFNNTAIYMNTASPISIFLLRENILTVLRVNNTTVQLSPPMPRLSPPMPKYNYTTHNQITGLDLNSTPYEIKCIMPMSGNFKEVGCTVKYFPV